jgi:dethiobiotin synthetase
VTFVVCAGTGTEVGKTWVGAAVLSSLAADGLRVAARKPVQSFDPAETGPTDADVLAAATGEHPHDVCPAHRWYPAAMAPPMAAAVLERDVFTVNDLAGEVRWPSPDPDIRWLETIGGVRSPIAFDGDSADLCLAVAPDLVVLVADAGLGTINSVRLSAAVLTRWPVLVYLNRFDESDELHTLNRAWLADRDGFEVIVSAQVVAERLRGAAGGQR